MLQANLPFTPTHMAREVRTAGHIMWSVIMHGQASWMFIYGLGPCCFFNSWIHFRDTGSQSMGHIHAVWIYSGLPPLLETGHIHPHTHTL